MLKDLLRQSTETMTTDPDGCLEWVRNINERYLNLERNRIAAEELVTLKFDMGFWRSRLLDTLLDRPPEWAKIKQAQYADVLLNLNVYIPDPNHAGLADRLRENDLFAQLMARQGIRLEKHPLETNTAGPGIDLKITANRRSSWSFNRWKNLKDYGSYEFEGHGAHYRGVFFLPGDVLLSNVNLDGNGVFTALSDPQGFCSHSAFFVILRDHHQRFPAVIETYEKGVRAVPLNVFLGPRFSSYTEVYRHEGLSSQHFDLINSSALNLMESVRGYNFDTEDKARSYMSCTSVGRFLLEDAGIEAVRTKSVIDTPTIMNNLRRVGYENFSIFVPVDYLLDENFSCVGWVDNNQFMALLARELVQRHFRHSFAQRKLDPDQFPFMYKLNRWGIRQIRRQTLFGKVISLIEGFDHVSLPKGPDKLISVITLVEAQLGKATRKTRRFLDDHLKDDAQFDLESVLADGKVRATLERYLDLPWLQQSGTAPTHG
jgi:hypothetical protein